MTFHNVLKSAAAPTVLAFAMLSQPAFAQVAEDDAVAANADSVISPAASIVVTGSRITNPNLVQSSPVNVVGEEEIELRQATNAEELIGELPGVAPGISSSVNNGSGGFSTFNLRNLGSNRNLVLLDGTRLVPSSTASQTDLNIIPVALIDRVEILTGGASSVYGADAISGVLNFVLKDDFEGAEIASSLGINEDGDGKRFRTDVTLGANFDDGRGNAVLSLGYQKTDPVFMGERAFSRDTLNVDGNEVGSGTSAPTRINGSQYDPATGALVPTYNTYNFAPFNYFQTPLERYNVFGQADYEVAEGIEVYGKGMFTKSTVSLSLAPAGLFGDTYQLPLNNAFLTPQIQDSLCATNAGRIADAGYANCEAAIADGFEVPTAINRRLVEQGPRQTDYVTNQFQIWGGVRGAVTSLLDFDLYGTYGESDRSQTNINWGLKSRVQQALRTVDADTCLDDSNGCYPINLFGDGEDVDPRSVAFFNAPTLSSTKTSLTVINGSISGDLTDRGFLGATTPIGIAVGSEYRKYTAQQQSDAASATQDEVLGSGAPSPSFSGEYDVWEVFGETIIPLIEDVPGIYSLTAEAGARYSKYSNAGETFTWKAGGTYEPFEGLRVRGIYQRSERAPNIGELFDPVTTGLSNQPIDPCAGSNPVGNATLTAICIAQGAPADMIGSIDQPSAGQVNATSGGNPDLGTEKADSFTAGVILTPPSIPGFALTVDYYNIKITDAITTPTPGDILNPCYEDYNEAACALIGRNPLNGSLNGGGDTLGLILNLTNQGTIKTSGVDARLTYNLPTGFGGLNFDISGNWTKEYYFQSSPTSEPTVCSGEYGTNCDPGQPEFSFNTRVTADLREAGQFSVLWRWMDGMKYDNFGSEDVLEEYQSIDSYSYFDLTYRNQVTDNFALSATVYNLLDKDPPVVSSYIGSTAYNSGNTYPVLYDVLGRRFMVTTTLSF